MDFSTASPCNTDMKLIPLETGKGPNSRNRSFLKDKHQLETVLGPSKLTWFDELTHRAYDMKKEPLKQHVTMFDSPVGSPTISQLIRNHLKVGQSPPVAFHSSPAVVGYHLQDDTPCSSPDSCGLWQRPTLGISPVPKDLSFYHQSSSTFVASLGLLNDDSTLSWTNSLATPPREDSANEPDEQTDRTQSRHHKDPVRALFSPASKLDTTSDSLEVLESTYEEDHEGSFLSNMGENPGKTKDVSQNAESAQYSDSHGTVSGDSCHASTAGKNADMSFRKIVPNKNAIDMWRDNLRRTFIVKSDSFGKKQAAEDLQVNSSSDKLIKPQIELSNSPKEQNDLCTDKVGDGSSSSHCVMSVVSLNKVQSQSCDGSPQEQSSKNSVQCTSPVFVKQKCSGENSKKSRSVKSGRKREWQDSGVIEALSDFFDPPSRATGQRNAVTKRRKSADLDQTCQQNIAAENQPITTPQNTVILHSILMKDKHLRSSSGKKVRFSESVTKYTKQKVSSDKYSKKAKKQCKVLKVNKVDQEDAMTRSRDKLPLQREEKKEEAECTSNKTKSETTDFIKLTKYGDNPDSSVHDNEPEDVFSQVSPTALEEMCDAAKVDSSGDKILVHNTKQGNSGDDGQNICEKPASQHKQVKPRRFLYPSKRQIVVTSPREVFKYKEDEKGDNKSKGIVMAIKSDSIISTEKKETKASSKGQESKVDVMDATLTSSGLKTPAKLLTNSSVVNGREGSCSSDQASEVYAMMENKYETSKGFQTASGKGCNLSETALEKAKKIFAEEKSSYDGHDCVADTSYVNDRHRECLQENSLTKNRHEGEQLEFSEWCEDFDIDDFDPSVNKEKEFGSSSSESVTAQVEGEMLDEHGLILNVKKEPAVTCNAAPCLPHCDNPTNESKGRLDLETIAKKKACFNRVTENSFLSETDISKSEQNLDICKQHTENFIQKNIGFSTASGKELKLDEERLRTAQDLLAVSFEKDVLNAANAGNMNIDTNDMKDLDVFNCEQTKDFESLNPKFEGFATASGKCLKLSTEAMQQAETLLKDNGKVNNKMRDLCDRTKTTGNEKSGLSVDEIFAAEMEGGTRLECEFEVLKSMKAKISSVNESKVSDVPQLTSFKLPAHSDKPKGFCPFKAPKRISEGNRGKVPSTLNNSNDHITAESIHSASNFNIESSESVQSLNNFLTDQSREGFGTKKTDTNVPRMAEAELEVHLSEDNGICEGIFSQMFADDMELEDNICTDNNYNENVRHETIVSKELDVVEKKTHERAISPCLEHKKCLHINKDNCKGVNTTIEIFDNDNISHFPTIPEFQKKDEKQSTISRSYSHNGLSGFQTAGGHKLKISQKALEKARHVLEGDIDESIEEPEKTMLQRHCNSKDESNLTLIEPVKVAETQLLEHTSGLASLNSFNDNKQIHTEHLALRTNSQLASATDSENTSQNLSALNNSENCKGTEFSKIVSGSTELLGFVTANGKQVKLSSDVLVKAEKMLNEDKVSVSGQSFLTNKLENVEKDLTEKNRSEGEDILDLENPFGLRIENGAVKGVSANLSNSAKIFDEVQQADNETFLREDHGKDASSLCTTRSHGTITSPQIIGNANARQLANENLDKIWPIECDDGYETSNLLHCGFQTASGKTVITSEKGFEASEKLLADGQERIFSDKYEDAEGTDNETKPLQPLFHGFQTAKGVCVTISNSALQKVKNLFGEESTVEQKIPSVDNDPYNDKKGKTKEQANDNKEDNNIKFQESIVDKKTSASPMFTKMYADVHMNKSESVFLKDKVRVHDNRCASVQTSDTNNVYVSKKSLETTLNNFNDPKGASQPPITGFQTSSGVGVPVHVKALEKVRKTFEEQVSTCIEESPQPLYMGFQTANGITVNFSTNAFNKARNVLSSSEEITEDIPDGFQKAFESKEHESKMALCKVLQSDSESLQENNTIGKMYNSLSMGFHTASGNMVNISKNALNKAMDCLSNLEGFKQDFPDDFGFQTASGKKVQVSDTALEKVKERYSENLNEKDCMNEIREPLSVGFQTASGNRVGISRKALDKAKSTLSSIEEYKQDFPDDFGFQTASGKKVQVSDTALEKVKERYSENLDEKDCMNDIQESLSDGFLTASGNRVDISRKALEKAKSTLSSIEEFKQDFPDDFGFQTASGKKVQVSDTALEKVKERYSENLNENDCMNEIREPLSVGFLTASGNRVDISRKALEKAKSTLSSLEEYKQDFPGDFGFQTASGKKVQVSDTALEKVKERYSENLNKNDCMNEIREPLSVGFQTAGGNRVDISRKALDKARNSLSNLEEFQKDFPDGFGFQTASGNKIQVSETALEKVKERNIEISHELDTIDKMSEPLSMGFQTASGNMVNVSRNALNKARDSLSNLEELGFQTASGSKVHVSENALKMARAGDSEIDFHVEKGHRQSYPLSKDTPCMKMAEEVDTDVSVELDMHLPIKRQKLGHLKERGILQQSGYSESLLKRKPLRSAPEGFSTDRRHPGFRPFIPVRSRFKAKPKQSEEEHLNFPGTGKDSSMTSFKTPYKKSAITKQNCDITNPQCNDQVITKVPVFHCKFKSGSTETKENDSFESQNKLYVRPAMCGTDNQCHSAGKVAMSKTSPEPIVSQIGNVETNDIEVPKVEQTQDLSSCKKNPPSSDLETVTMETCDLGSSSQDEEDVFYCNLVEARRKQEQIIQCQKTKKIEPVPGRLYQLKTESLAFRVKLADVATGPCNLKEKQKVPVTSMTAEDYKFRLRDHYGNRTAHVLLGDGAFLVPDDEGMAGKQEFYRAFLTMEGVAARLISEGWIYNHYRWIVWKLAAYQLTCQALHGRSLTPENVMLQLKYRYDREIDRAERSCLKKIYERDDAASKRLVLCVSYISVRSDSNIHVNSDLSKIFIELTDGWYKIPAQIDGPLANLIQTGKIIVGTKLCLSGADLIGGQDACSPLEAPSSIQLKININSTRPVSWYCCLGYQKDPRPLCVPLVSLFEEGGTVGVVDVVLVRKYPVMYMEKLSSGSCVFRSLRNEEKAQQDFQTRRQTDMEKLYNQIQKQIESEQTWAKKQNQGSKKYSKLNIEQLLTGEEIYEAIETSTQPDTIQNYLTDRQQGLLYEYQRCLQEEKRQELNMRVQSAWREKEEKMPTDRNVTPVLKLRLAGCSNRDLDSSKTTILTVWRPAPEICDLQEGKRYKIYSLNTSSARSKYTGSSVQLTATKQTKFLPMVIDENLLDRIYEPREVLWVCDIKKRQPFCGEMDFVGLIVKKVLAGTLDGVRNPDMLYLADCQSNHLAVKFWSGFKSFGSEDIFTEGVCVCMSNLMDKSSFRNKNLPVVEATTDYTNITCKPQNACQRNALEKLQSIIKNKSTFKEDVLKSLEDQLSNPTSSLTPKKYQRQVHTVHTKSSNPQDKAITDTNPIKEGDVTCVDITLKQNALANEPKTDQDPSGHQQQECPPVTPTSESRQRSTQCRIAKLSAYGAPMDDLSPLPVTVPRSVSRSFKPPAFRKKLN